MISTNQSLSILLAEQGAASFARDCRDSHLCQKKCFGTRDQEPLSNEEQETICRRALLRSESVCLMHDAGPGAVVLCKQAIFSSVKL